MKQTKEKLLTKLKCSINSNQEIEMIKDFFQDFHTSRGKQHFLKNFIVNIGKKKKKKKKSYDCMKVYLDL